MIIIASIMIGHNLPCRVNAIHYYKFEKETPPIHASFLNTSAFGWRWYPEAGSKEAPHFEYSESKSPVFRDSAAFSIAVAPAKVVSMSRALTPGAT